MMLMVVMASLAPTAALTDFAFGYDLEVSSDAPIAQLQLPQDVYSTVTKSDFGDLRVFDKEGRELPYAVVMDEAKEAGQRTESVQLLAVRGPKNGSGESLDVELVKNNTQVTFRARTQAAQEDVVQAYFATTEPGLVVQQVTFAWQPLQKGFVERVRLATSDNLQTWNSAGELTLAELRHGTERKLHDMAQTHFVTQKYLRVVAASAVLPTELTDLALQVGSEAQAPQTLWLGSSLTERRDVNTYDFMRATNLSVQTAHVFAGDANALMFVELLSSPTPEGPFVTRHRGFIYRLVKDGEVVESPPLTFGSTTDRYFRLSTDGRGGGFGMTPPRLEFGIAPHSIWFVRRGDAPFVLAFGSAAVSGAAFDRTTLLTTVNREAPPSQSVPLTPRYDLGGSARLTPEPPPVAWKTITLWLVLVLGAGLVGIIAVRTLREMNSAGA